jgi:hypothetical protein
MRTLTARRALDAWEQGQRTDPQGRSLALLAAVLPEVEPQRLARLPLGQRDALLLRLRERTLGRLIKGLVKCPTCNTRLEFPFDLSTYDAAATLARRHAPVSFTASGFAIRFRLPDSEDLTAAGLAPDVETARGLLVARCVLAAEREGRPVPPWELPEELLEEIGRRMEELDPLSFLPLNVDCPRCSHQWTALLDVGALFWQEISVSAERLLQDVHTLAMAYGWGEAEILGMSEARRRFYLKQIPATAVAGPSAPAKGRPKP